MKEGSEFGSVPLTNGSGAGSRKPKNIRIRIRNTDFYLIKFVYFPVAGGGGGASGDGGLSEQGGGQAQYPQCRHQAHRQHHTKIPLKKLTVHFIFPGGALSCPVLFPLLVLSCPFVS